MAMSTKMPNETNDEILAVDAGLGLLQNSCVLCKDARYTSLEQVLSSCTSHSTKAFPDGCNAPWSTLVEDCANILSSHRLVGRALLEACDLLKTAVQHLKEENACDDKPSNNKEVMVQLRQVRKKVEFFLSWSQQAKEEFGESIKNALTEWIKEWTSNEFRSESDDGLISSRQELELPGHTNIQQPSKQKSTTAPLIVEVSRSYNKN
jgi:hypothetical protein